MRANTPNPARLSTLWFGIQCVWGAVLGISLQARCIELGGAGSLAAYGEISTLGALAAAITQLIVGPYSDVLRRHGNRRIAFYVVGALGGAFAASMFYHVSTLPALLVSFVGLQTAMNVAIGPYQAILPDFMPRDRIGIGSGWMAAMQSGGNAVGAILASALASHVYLAGTLAAILVTGGISTVTHVRKLTLEPATTGPRLHVTRTFVDLFVSRAFVYLGFYTLLGYFFFYVRNALPKTFPIDATMASGICVLLFTLVGALGAAFAAKPSDRLDERLVVTIGGGILASAVALLAVTHTLTVIPIAIAVAGVGWGIFLCADWAFACRLLPPGSLATTMSVWNLAVVGPQMLAPLIATVFLTRMSLLASLNGPRFAFALASVEVLLGAIWIWRLSPSKLGK